MKEIKIAILLILNSLYSFAQKDTSEVLKLNEQAWNLRYTNIDSAKLIANQALKLSLELNFISGTASSYNNLGVVNRRLGNYDSAIFYFNKSLGNRNELGNHFQIGKSYNNLGLVYMDLGKYEESIQNFLKAQEIFDDLNEAKGKAGCLVNIGIIHYHQKKLDLALKNYHKAIRIYTSLGENRILGIINNNIGSLYQDQKNLDSALYYFNKSLKYYEDSGDKYGIAVELGNIGIIYTLRDQYEDAIKIELQSLKIKEELKDKKGIGELYTHLSTSYRKLKNFEKSYEYIIKSLEIANEIHALDDKRTALVQLASYYEDIGDYKNSIKTHKEISIVKDSLINSQNNELMSEMEAKYHGERNEKEIEILKKDQEIKDHQIEKQLLTNTLLIGGIIFVLIIAGLIYWRYSAGQKAKHIISLQKDRLQSQNNHILDSIKYAKRIQEAILPHDKLVKEYLAESFIFYRPKDIVSGDFYWVEQNHAKNEILFAAVDCTGHGVPGAFMSIVGNNGLNKALREEKLERPADILNSLNSHVTDSLHKSNNKMVLDGMDIALCKLNYESNILEYSGAHNSLYIVPKELKKYHPNQIVFEHNDKYLVEIKANKFAIGEKHDDFINHEIQLNKGDTIYVFTDGYADQFGGPKNRKLTYKKFKNLIIEINNLPLNMQKDEFSNKFDNWKGNEDQLDDICIIGVRI